MASMSPMATEAGSAWPGAAIGRVAAPVREQVIAALRQAILDFHFAPGQRLIERELMEMLGVSRATVREALSVLTSEGLVTVVPQKGAHVSAPSLSESEDLYDVRAALESLVVRRFIERATPEQIARLRASVEVMRAMLADDPDIRDFLAAKDDFYAVLIEGAQSASLAQLLESIQARVRALRVTSLSTENRLARVVQELSELVDAVADHNTDRASRLLTEHIHMAARLALSALRSTD